MKNVSVFLLGLLVSFPAIGASGSTGYFDITRIRVGGGFVRVSGASFKDPSDCAGAGTNTSSNLLIMETAASYKEMVSILLAAKMANKPVQFWVNGCDNDSGKLYPSARHIYLQ